MGHSKRANFLPEKVDDSDSKEVFTMYLMKASEITIYTVHEEKVTAWEEQIKSKSVPYEADTGCGYTKGTNKPRLVKCRIKLRMYSGHGVQILGAAKVVKVEWQLVHKIDGRADTPQEALSRYQTVFKDAQGMLKSFIEKIHVASDATPCFYKLRSVPFDMKKKVEQELERLLQERN